MNLQHLSHHEIAIELEHKLGDPNDVDSIMSYKRVMELDEQEAFQEEFFQYLLSLKSHHYYVPVEFGGKLKSYEQLFSMAKVLARRDLATAVTMSTMVWSTLVWLGGSQQMKERCAKITMSIDGAQCLAYSEENHGSDLLSNELTATENGDGYILNGEKWPINRAARSNVVMLLAKTSNDKGGRNLSLFMVEKSKIDCSKFTYLPKIKTYGLRGCDICGIRFSGAKIPKSALIGKIGDGLELGIKAFQVTRTLCAALSIGALENNLRVVMDFALNRQLYKGSVFEIPNARHYLIGAFTDLLVADATGCSLSRALHVVPRQFSVLSAVAKYFAPYKLDNAQKDLSTVLGARFFFREKHKEGIFQKSLRDSQVVSLFDGSSEVNLYSLNTQLPILARRQRKIYKKGEMVDQHHLKQIFDATVPVTKFDGGKLDLSCHGKDMIMESWPLIISLLTQRAIETPVANVVLRLAHNVFNAHQENLTLVMGMRKQKLALQSPGMFNLSRQYSIVHAAACAINYWLFSARHSDAFIASGDWLVFGLQRLLSDMHIDVDIDEHFLANISNELFFRSTNSQSYGLVSLPLPDNNLKQKGELS